jgi:hypothetical protein
MREKLRYFGFSLSVTVAALIGVIFGLGWASLTTMIVLILIEVTFSFENAIINAKVLRSLSDFWQKIFLTVGILIAIFGMRVLFPILIVVVTAHLPWQEVIDLALHNPDLYAEKLTSAHHLIAAFGGGFLLMLFFSFFFDKNKETHWIGIIERPIQQVSRNWLPGVLSLATIVGVALLPANHYQADTMRAGIAGILTYLAVRGLEHLFAWVKDRGMRKHLAEEAAAGNKAKAKLLKQTGWAAFTTFLYLEILDASFSFDGVIGAFAITKSVILIAAGLGVGAVWVRSLTVYMVHKGTLDKYKYLEHGAHYTVGVLAATLLLGIFMHVPEAVAGVVGVTFVGSAFVSSRRMYKRGR